jgi:hypothetical protein
VARYGSQFDLIAPLVFPSYFSISGKEKLETFQFEKKPERRYGLQLGHGFSQLFLDMWKKKLKTFQFEKKSFFFSNVRVLAASMLVKYLAPYTYMSDDKER